jgi:hypothetical protein
MFTAVSFSANKRNISSAPRYGKKERRIERKTHLHVEGLVSIVVHDAELAAER